MPTVCLCTGDTQIVTLDYNTSGLAQGSYDATIWISTNDAQEGSAALAAKLYIFCSKLAETADQAPQIGLGVTKTYFELTPSAGAFSDEEVINC